MTPIPIDLPLRPSEAGELAQLILEQAEGKPLTGELRNRLASRAVMLKLATVRPYFGGLARDPVHPSSYYLPVDGEHGDPFLLHIALSTAPTSSIFFKPLLIGRMRRPLGPEIVINAVPFAPADTGNLDLFAAKVDPAFLPRPQGGHPAIAIETAQPEAILPEVFDGLRGFLRRTGRNLAAVHAAEGAPFGEVYYGTLWSAIRAGWRDGVTVGAEIIACDPRMESVKEATLDTAHFTRFTVDCSCFFDFSSRSAAEVESKFESLFSAEERSWILDEFARPLNMSDDIDVWDCELPAVLSLAVEYGRGLKSIELAHEWIRQTRSALKTGKSFDLDLCLSRTPALTGPRDLVFCLHWLKAHGHAAQFVTPNVAGVPDLEGHLKTLAAVCRHYQCLLSLDARGWHSGDIEAAGRATCGKLNLRVALGAEAPGPAIAELARQLAG